MENTKSIIPGLEKNMSRLERIFSLLYGSYELYNGLTERKTRKTIMGGYLLFRGVAGYCPLYGAMHVDHSKEETTEDVSAEVMENEIEGK